jgi:hypothetical protein
MAGALISNSDEDDNRMDTEPEDYNEEQTLLARYIYCGRLCHHQEGRKEGRKELH